MTDLVKLYNPANSSALTPEQIDNLKHLTSEQIKELATAYPNRIMNRPFLLIMDTGKPIDKQLPGPSTFENLWNLRERNGLRQYVIYGFIGGVKQVRNIQVNKKTEIKDLSETELLSLPGFKTKNLNTSLNFEQVKITKVKKEKIQ